ncbi:MAG: 50S ribosomal protein L29 [Candidatus Aenigmatarchaeota archaeon]|nr:50S ribosomal protein L29 [Candidatus Aenigmarchaeota archaeon]
MKKKDLKKMSESDLDKQLKELRLDLLKEKGNVEMGGNVKNPGKIRAIRKTIARILTLKSQKSK